MKTLLQSFSVAFSMYSRLPVPQVEWNEKNMKYAFCFFPLIGVFIGGVVWLWLQAAAFWGFGDSLRAAVCVALPLLITGGIHLDGFCDTVDALSSHQSRERKLEILKDPHIGAFALIGCGVYLLLAFGLWAELSLTPRQAAALCVGFVVSRGFSGMSIVTFPCAKNSGTAAMFSQGAQKQRVRAVMGLFLGVCLAVMVYLGGLMGLCCFSAAALVFLYYRLMSQKQFGGITGDLAGFFLQMAELAMPATALIASLVS